MPVSACPSSGLDPWADDVLADPWPAYRELQDLGPVVQLDRYGVYCIARYDDVRAALQDWETFSSAGGVGMDPDLNASSGRGILSTDPPLHDTRRRVLNPQLVPRALTPHQAFIDERAEDLVAGLVERGSFDAVHDLARPYSLGVVADLVGIPETSREHLIDWATCAFNTFGPRNELLASSMDGFRRLVDYANRVAVPDVLEPGRWGAQIYEAAERGDVEPEACPGLMLAYLWAGMDTTVNAIAAAVFLFATNPEQWALVRDDVSLVPSATNEVLRIHAPVQRFTRVTTRDVDVSGTVIPPGRGCSRCSGRRTATRATTRTPTCSTCAATRSTCWPSAAASTTAWDRTWPGSSATPCSSRWPAGGPLRARRGRLAAQQRAARPGTLRGDRQATMTPPATVRATRGTPGRYMRCR